MSFRHTASFALCAAAGLTMIAAPANACDNPSCFEVHPGPAAQTETAVPAKPLPLAKFVGKPIATAAVRTTKTRSGQLVQVTYRHHPKAKMEAKAETRPLVMPTRPEVTTAPAVTSIPSAAAQAFASVPYSTARVRIVTLEDLADLDAKVTAAAFAAAPIANNAPETAYNGVQVVNAADVNDIDLKSDSVEPAALDVATPEKAPSENATLLQRMLLALGGAFATAAAAVKALIG